MFTEEQRAWDERRRNQLSCLLTDKKAAGGAVNARCIKSIAVAFVFNPKV